MITLGASARRGALRIDRTGYGELKWMFVALGLYRSAGYVEREAFGEYKADPLSVFMEKRL